MVGHRVAVAGVAAIGHPPAVTAFPVAVEALVAVEVAEVGKRLNRLISRHSSSMRHLKKSR